MRVRHYCSIPGCAGRLKGGTWCGKHWERFKHHGSTDDPRPTDEERFWRKVTKGPSCWLWTGSTTKGYGVIRFRGKQHYAHRVMWLLARGSIPDATPHLDHLCRVRLCVNPEHLEPVTQAENNLRSWAARKGIR